MNLSRELNNLDAMNHSRLWTILTYQDLVLNAFNAMNSSGLWMI